MLKLYIMKRRSKHDGLILWLFGVFFARSNIYAVSICLTRILQKFKMKSPIFISDIDLAQPISAVLLSFLRVSIDLTWDVFLGQRRGNKKTKMFRGNRKMNARVYRVFRPIRRWIPANQIWLVAERWMCVCVKGKGGCLGLHENKYILCLNYTIALFWIRLVLRW